MLDDKTMVSDALAGVNGELVRYGEMISQTENKELKAQIAELEKKAQQEETSDFSDSDLESKQEEQNKVYGLNETWTVDGLWSLTFTSVTQTEERNQYSDKTPAQVIYLNYDYENYRLSE